MSKSIGQNRILQEMKSMVKERPENLFAQPLENDMFIWHFTILGPENTDFHEGIYHGQIVLPFEYPFKPPDIYFFTKNGRFQIQTKICLTITQYHPEEWNAAWTIRTMLEAVISLFNQHVPGVGYVESSSDTRKSLAKESHSFTCEKCGSIKNILKVRKPMPAAQPLPSVLPKPMPFAAHDSRKLSQVMLFAQDSKQDLKQDQPSAEHPMTEVKEQPSVQPNNIAQQKKAAGSKSIFLAGNGANNVVKDNLRLLQWVNITSKFTKRND